MRDGANEIVLREVQILKFGTVVESFWKFTYDVVIIEIKGCKVLKATNERWDCTVDVLVGKA